MDFSTFWGLSLQGNRAKGMPFAATSCFLYIVYEYGMLLDSHTLCSEAGFAYSLYSNAVNRVMGEDNTAAMGKCHGIGGDIRFYGKGLPSIVMDRLMGVGRQNQLRESTQQAGRSAEMAQELNVSRRAAAILIAGAPCMARTQRRHTVVARRTTRCRCLLGVKPKNREKCKNDDYAVSHKSLADQI
ncbi:MAG: hypothetical protein P8X96_14320 [Desulfobacteraceae bacterium]